MIAAIAAAGTIGPNGSAFLLASLEAEVRWE